MKERLLVSDLDGVVALGEKTVPEVIEGFDRIRENGVATTLATGRNFRRLKGILGVDYSRIISSKYLGKPNLLIVDGGGTVMKTNGEGYHAFPIDINLRRSIIDTLRHTDPNFIAFDPNPLHPGTPEVWIAPHFNDRKLLTKFRETYTLIEGPFDALAKRLDIVEPSNIAVSLNSGTAYDLELPSGINRSANRGIFDLNVSGKDMALSVVQNYFDQSSLRFCIYIGDGWRQETTRQGDIIAENDRPVLLLRDLGMRIIVSESPVYGIDEPYVIVKNAQGLGKFLSDFPKTLST
ncbi:MAG: hypothetical protein AAB583_03515 [Patescibacteria group bacterium]